ncbi:MAG: MFS transporter [Anaerolineae bacterium]
MQIPSARTRPIALAEVIVACYLSMFLLGLASNIYGPALVYLAAETHESPATLGLLVVFQWVGFLSSALATNRFARRFEVRRSMVLATALVGLGVLGLIGLPVPLNLASALVIGLGAGMTEILLNRLVELLAAGAPAAELNRIHAMWGLGAVMMPLAVVGAVWLGLGWRGAGLVAVGVAILTAGLIVRWREFTVPHGAGVDLKGLAWRSILLLILMFIIYVGAEVAVGTWATTFFAKLGQGPFLGAIATSFFFVTFTIGRLTLAAVPERVGYARSIRGAMLLAAGALALTLYTPLAVVGFALTGIAMSIVFPTLFAWAARRHPEIRPQIASVVLAATAAGGILLPYAFGWGVELWGAWTLPPMLIAASLTVSLLTLFEPNAN